MEINFTALDARKVFLEWHAKEKAAGTQFDMQRDLTRYCWSDVDILARCCMKFRDLFIQVNLSKTKPSKNSFSTYCFTGNHHRSIPNNFNIGRCLQFCVSTQISAAWRPIYWNCARGRILQG